MSTHPLHSEDYFLVQDFLVTKVTMLLASHAEQNEWRHEIAEMRRAADDAWGRRDGFLLDYTIARFLAAAIDVDDSAARLAAGPEDEFLREFTHAVREQDYAHADDLWIEVNLPATGFTEELLPTTHALVVKISHLPALDDPASIIEHLPNEYFPPSFVS